ncbi:hypothetical protein [Sphingomonas qomolangmaensis]|uniref:SbsA Ig-like domain-containing protein n=1 Tax=Sphingomonas qomolangmaensis TaxID=2918765 RepID=A0ABY5LDC2_9SPHN|nr:hypothetical protein [Sphingomonas qomolangmaensis]UUL84023.1 hypothetical protein NMP03_07500 [Sphingomonas qomolangmaensis]
MTDSLQAGLDSYVSDWIVRGDNDLSNRLPPVVTAVSIPTGTRNVPPGPCELRITFSEPMADQSWSVIEYGRDSIPKIDGLPQLSAEDTELSLSLVLEPGRIYAFWLNNNAHFNFKDRSGTPLVPYLVGFHTAP